MSHLTDLVATRADADPTLNDEAALLVYAALEGEEALADLAGLTLPEAVRRRLLGRGPSRPGRSWRRSRSPASAVSARRPSSTSSPGRA